MPRIEWTEQLSLGIPEIDEQHQQLINIANLLLAAVHAGKGERVITKTVTDLREYTVQHFVKEEEYMAIIGYPRLQTHAETHEDLVRQVKEYQRRLWDKGGIDPNEMLAFIKGWLIDHILYSDLDISAWLRKKGAEEMEKADEEGKEDERPEQGQTSGGTSG